MRRLHLLMLTLAIALSATGAFAQTYDVTPFYLSNSGFDTDFDYTIDDTGNVAQEILDVKGWTKNITVNYTITGVYQIGTKKTFNGASIPSVGQDGTTNGGVLALSTGWEQSMLFYQDVVLPAGSYALVTAFYNSADKTAGRSRVAWIPTGKPGELSGLTSFPIGIWVTDTIRFELTESTKGKIQIGFYANANQGSANFAKPCLDFVKLLRDTPIGSADMDAYKNRLRDAITEAYKLYDDGTGNGATELKEAITAAEAIVADENATKENVDQAEAALAKATEAYLWANPTGNVPTVTTDPRFARGATMAFGRMSYTGVRTTEVTEAGFCWSETSEPTINDERTTKYLSNNGNIYWLRDLRPATRYYMRPYVITKGRQVGYGDIIKFYTIPKGTITFNQRASSDAAADARIKAAAETAIGWWNDLTEMKGFSPNIGYEPGTPTADCSYGGWMRVGSNQSYQKAGTIMHEMLHGCGVIPWADTEWSRFDLRSGTSNAAGYATGSGLWLGDRVTAVLRFWDNNNTSQLNGDYQHMWPYGINGANEDNGSDVLYIGNSLVCQALGEDGLQHTYNLFAEPYYSLDQEDDIKYYIKNEDAEHGLYTSLLIPQANGTLRWRAMTAEEAAANDSCAWYITFTPGNQYYQLRNAATGQYMTTLASTIRTAPRTALTANEDFHLMPGRVDVGGTNHRGYWLIHPTGNWTPSCLQADANGSVTAAVFSISNAATSQRWLILNAEELATLSDNMLAEMKGQVAKKLEQVKALADVPHSEDEAGTDTTFDNALNNIGQQLTSAGSTTDLQTLLDELDKAAFDFLANATPTDMSRPFDLTYLIANPDMQSTDGWSDSPTINYSCAEYYEKTFDFNQTVKNLPAGTYQMRVQAFQRPGRAEECTSKTTTALVYAGDKTVRMAHITANAQTAKLGGSESYVGGKYFPNNMQAASIYFGKGFYENSVTTQVGVDGGTIKMGLRCTSMPSYYWCIFDNFRLHYFGSLTPNEVDGISIPIITLETTTRQGIYSLDGQKLRDRASEIIELPAGIYIVNGKKVVVR